MEIPGFDEAKFREIMECDEKTVAINAFASQKRKREASQEKPVSKPAEEARERLTV